MQNHINSLVYRTKNVRRFERRLPVMAAATLFASHRSLWFAGSRGSFTSRMGSTFVSRERGHLRQSAVTGDWVVFASARAARPRQTADLTSTEKTSKQEAHEDDCPFCSGNEERTGPSLYTLPGQDGNWALRVVRNKYPAVEVMRGGEDHLSRERLEHESESGLILNATEDARGYHDVIVETPRHNLPLALDGVERTEMLLRAWRDRGAQIAAEDERIRHLLYFKNQGSGGGASILHPHSQLVGLPVVPESVQRGQERAMSFFCEHGVSVFEQTLEEELADGSRVVDSNEDFVSFVPFAARSPFSLKVVPVHEWAHFEKTPDARLGSLASLLRRSLRRLHVGLGEPDYNLMINSSPIGKRGLQRGASHVCGAILSCFSPPSFPAPTSRAHTYCS